ncbi:fluoride efflux transporter FluC [Bifidobacterium cuniculi]|uniref:Fluoride-specific ion channel FluC n=1 Tax=Bifidobacterium cuniculi TaxID=1688 RepID=A0A087B3B1_9BIFI|nr:CrcB family protein [Bifidobacterium cuniculi]KFI65511.1 CrcB protein [Bifidobacterium cuniculi]
MTDHESDDAGNLADGAGPVHLGAPVTSADPDGQAASAAPASPAAEDGLHSPSPATLAHDERVAREVEQDVTGTGWPDDQLDDALRRELLSPHPTGAAAARKPPSVPLAPLKRMQARFNPLADFLSYVVIFLGGAVGTGLRYLLWLSMPASASGHGLLLAFHPATFLANMIACFLFAMLTSYTAQAIWMKKRTRQLMGRGIGMGICGGFSTLSAMMVEDITALHTGGYLGFFLYTMLSFILGIAVAWFGSWLGVRLTAKRVGSENVAEALRNLQHAKPAIGVRVPVDPSTQLTSSSLGSLAARTDDPDPDTDEIPVVPDPMTGEVK